MKRLVLTLSVLLGLALGGVAQNVWKPIEMEGVFLGVSADGSIFSNCGYSGLHRSQDEGATWELNYDTYVSSSHFTINDNNRIFIFNDNSHKLCYSDDNGDTWQEQASGISTNWVEGMYSLSNDTIVMINNEKFFWTLDGGESWSETSISFLQDMVFASILADHAGNVYISITNAVPIYELGIYTANLNDIDNWTWLIDGGAMIHHMELDPEGNVVAGGYGQYQQQPGLYLVPDWRFTVADNGIVYDLHNVGDDGYDYAVLRYSADHGETFYEYGEALPLYSPAPGGMGDGSIYKGRDGHLYFGGHGARMKSVFNTNDIHYIEGEVVVLPDAFAFGNYPYGAGQAIRVDDDHIYPVTVDGFRPDPTDLSRLIVRYDTIPMGATIGAFGTIREMHDYVGDSQNVLDIQQTTAHYNDAIISMLNPEEDKVKIRLPKPPYTSYYITINGEKQDWPLVFNGVPYYNTDLLTFIGHCDIMIDQYANQFNGMELADIQPFKDYTFQLDDGWLTTDFWAQPCLSCPCEEDENQHFLTFVGPGDYIIPYYPVHNGRLFKETFINNDIFREGMHVDIKGIQYLRYDMPGEEVNVIELVEMDTDEETTLTGRVEWAPMPYTAYVPLPGLIIAFVANGKTYYLDNEQSYYDDWFLVGNDTIHIGQEITATFTLKILIDNGLDFYYRIHINEAEVVNQGFPLGSEWYYEIQNENGSITYQYMYLAGDTIVNDEPTQILVKINTLYDKGPHEEITREYVYERDGKVYWWNKTLEEFTVLYDFSAQVDDSWVIKVGTETLIMHVNAVETLEYEGKTYRMLHVSDAGDFFSGDIVCGIGHLTSFFPERLMNNGDGLRVEGLRCYWIEDELVFNLDGEEECDAIYSEVHGIEEGGPSTPSTGSGTAGTVMVYPNPTDGVLVIETHDRASLQGDTYRISNMMGQVLLQGQIMGETQRIDVLSLPQGMYFITVGEGTRKFVVNR